jgi:hypothetical protein
MVAADSHQGGATWAVLQYVLGLRRLGHEVLLLEPVDALTPARAASFEATTREFGLSRSAALVECGSQTTAGLTWADVSARCRRSDLLINISGMLRDPELIGGIPVLVYLDLDPAFNQLWAAADGIDTGFAGHTHFATVGQLIGAKSCSIPTFGRDWIKTLPPVVLERWPIADEIRTMAFTTVGNWRAYGSIKFEGRHHGQKAHSMRQLIGIPLKSEHAFEVAFAIHPHEHKDLELLQANGWRLLEAKRVAGTPQEYRRFIQGSLAEIGIAKTGYVASRCGWFSDRSACYLASGRPVIAQDTGFGSTLPTGEGLLTFTDEDEAVAAADAVLSEYGHHRRAAREFAEEHLDSDRVLGRLLQAVKVA